MGSLFPLARHGRGTKPPQPHWRSFAARSPSRKSPCDNRARQALRRMLGPIRPRQQLRPLGAFLNGTDGSPSRPQKLFEFWRAQRSRPTTIKVCAKLPSSVYNCREMVSLNRDTLTEKILEGARISTDEAL